MRRTGGCLPEYTLGVNAVRTLEKWSSGSLKTNVAVVANTDKKLQVR